MTSNTINKVCFCFLFAIVASSIGACNKGAIPSNQAATDISTQATKNYPTSDVAKYNANIPDIPGYTPTGDPEMDHDLFYNALENLQQENPAAYNELMEQLPPDFSSNPNYWQEAEGNSSTQPGTNVKIIPYAVYMSMTPDQRAMIDANPDKYRVEKE